MRAAPRVPQRVERRVVMPQTSEALGAAAAGGQGPGQARPPGPLRRQRHHVPDVRNVGVDGRAFPREAEPPRVAQPVQQVPGRLLDAAGAAGAGRRPGPRPVQERRLRAARGTGRGLGARVGRALGPWEIVVNACGRVCVGEAGPGSRSYPRPSARPRGSTRCGARARRGH